MTFIFIYSMQVKNYACMQLDGHTTLHFCYMQIPSVSEADICTKQKHQFWYVMYIQYIIPLLWSHEFTSSRKSFTTKGVVNDLLLHILRSVTYKCMATI